MNKRGSGMETFKDYAYYYNAFYQDKNYNVEAKQVDTLLKKYGYNIKNIINFGCGTGKHDIELTKLGYNCAGIDLSSRMIEIARENAKLENVEIDFEVQDVRNFETQKKYDAVISLFHVMSYQNSNQDVLDAFRTARKALDKDGLFLFDAWYGPGVLNDEPSVRVKEIEDGKNRLIRIANPVMHYRENIVDVNYEVLVINKAISTVQTINETHRMRYFFEPEIQLMLEQTDFELIDSIDCQTLTDINYNTWTSFFVSRAK